ncbi:Crp/Fnr family transcriptional regulator [Algoriphagus boritolerans]|nr:Crp/Fnr family transcriptional regulator [Algoriphagus boritolerans]
MAKLHQPPVQELYAMILSHVQERISLSPDEQQFFCSLLKARQLLPRQYLVQEGEICRFESYVCRGLLRSFYLDREGNDHTLHFAMEDWWISDSASFIRQLPASRHVVALEPSIVLQLDKPSLELLYKEVPAFERFWRILHENATIAQDQRILNSITMTGAERYAEFLQKYPGIAARMPQKYIASYLGISSVFLSRIRGGVRKK